MKKCFMFENEEIKTFINKYCNFTTLNSKINYFLLLLLLLLYYYFLNAQFFILQWNIAIVMFILCNIF